MNTYWMQCNEMRVDELGERGWAFLMESAHEISLAEFALLTDATGLLDEDEGLADFVADDPTHRFLLSAQGVTIIETSGFEFFFKREVPGG